MTCDIALPFYNITLLQGGLSICRTGNEHGIKSNFIKALALALLLLLEALKALLN